MPRKKPVVVLTIGMAGSGKSTLMHRISLHVHESNSRGYFINLDPAVKNVSFGANIDIRDTVDYKAGAAYNRVDKRTHSLAGSHAAVQARPKRGHPYFAEPLRDEV
jgi:GTPase SAR1 family protein